MKCEDFLAQVAAIIWGVRWLNVALIVAVLLGAFLLYKATTNKDNTFDILDLIVNDQTRRADFSKISIIVFATLSVWVVVEMVLRDKPVETLLLGVLGVFVSARVLDKIFGKPVPDTTVTTATATTVSTTAPKTDPDVPVVPVAPPAVTATVTKTSKKSK